MPGSANLTLPQLLMIIGHVVAFTMNVTEYYEACTV